ncbi:MAG TPA: pantetheine-phosphate adenylyltransferase [Candidatus Cloacimonadota bacterium]|nr:pantetheine-phosphate adenylyltransferase [Candidatus Cloacimonadota bacterium]
MRRVIYPGTFDPITNGHLNILEKASKMFDEVILGVAEQTNKESLFTLEERTRLCMKATKHIPNVKVMTFSGLVVDFAKQMDSSIMIRGMRAVSDFEYELQLALMNKKLSPEIETIFMVPSYRYMYLSSSIIRQLAQLHAELDEFVPKDVKEALNHRFLRTGNR